MLANQPVGFPLWAAVRDAVRTPLAPPPGVHSDFALLPPPVIVAGMHRSGTSLTTLALARLGVYVGQETVPYRASRPEPGDLEDGYAESLDFRTINDELLAQAGSHWCDVTAFATRVPSVRFQAESVRRIARATHGRLRYGFLSALAPESLAWGWKDPRNCLTLPVWLTAFPAARIVHVRRDPEAAARSLHRRSCRWRDAPAPARPGLAQRAQWALRNPLDAGRVAARKLGLVRSARPLANPCTDLDYCRELADVYERNCLTHRSRAAGYIEIWYEEFVQTPKSALNQVGEFLGIQPSQRDFEWAESVIIPPAERYRN